MIAKYMGWSWAEFCDTPVDVIAVVVELMTDEAEALRQARAGR